MPLHASGAFSVQTLPQPASEGVGDPTIMRMSITKHLSGDLVGTSAGEMLTAGTDVVGSAGYVALERVTGTLAGRGGSFVLQHSGAMNRGAAQLTITVVPDSGTEQLVGLAGAMSIGIVNGEHHYDFSYTLPEAG